MRACEAENNKLRACWAIERRSLSVCRGADHVYSLCYALSTDTVQYGCHRQSVVDGPLIISLRSHRHEYESGFAFTGCLSLVQASPARVERSRSLVQAHNSTRVC